MIALGTTPVAEMMMTPMEFGSRCFMTTHFDFAPIASEASTYSCVRFIRSAPRTLRAMPSS